MKEIFVNIRNNQYRNVQNCGTSKAGKFMEANCLQTASGGFFGRPELKKLCVGAVGYGN